jgi:hypothetical protein
MATAPNLALGYGSEAYTKYTDAQKRLDDMLANRENRLFDPVMLAMSQGFLAPTKTGSFGESLGNVAAAVGPAQAAESKSAMDIAKMRLDVAQQGLATNIGLQQQQNINADIARNTVGFVPPSTAPAAPSAVQGTQAAGASVAPPAISGAPTAPAALPSTGGALPSGPAMPVAPAAPQGPLSTVAQAPQAPQAQQPSTGILGGIPLGIPASDGGMNMSPAEANIVKIGMAQGKTLPDMYKFVADRRNDETVWKEGFGVHRPTNTFIPAPSAEQVEIQLPGDKAPRKVFKSDSMALQHYAQTNDKRYNEVLDRMKNGPQIARQPIVPTGNPPGTTPAAAPSVGIPTTTDVAAEKSRAEAEASAAGTGAGKRTSAAMDKYETAMESKNAAISVKELIAQPGAELTMGVFEKPTVKAAILGMVRNREFDEDAFRDAYTKLNIKFNVPKKMNESEQDYTQRKQDILDRSREVASQAAMLQFQVSMLAKGQGQITDNERRLFAATTLGVKDSVSTMNRKADMIIERSNFAQKVADTISEKNISLDQFKRMPEYKAMEKAYEDKLRNIWNPSGAKTSGAQAPATGSPDLEAARRRLEARLP